MPGGDRRGRGVLRTVGAPHEDLRALGDAGTGLLRRRRDEDLADAHGGDFVLFDALREALHRLFGFLLARRPVQLGEHRASRARADRRRRHALAGRRLELGADLRELGRDFGRDDDAVAGVALGFDGRRRGRKAAGEEGDGAEAHARDHRITALGHGVRGVDGLVPCGRDLLLVLAGSGQALGELAEQTVAHVLERREPAADRRERGRGRDVAFELPLDHRGQLVLAELGVDLRAAVGRCVVGHGGRLAVRVDELAARAGMQRQLHRDGRSFKRVRAEAAEIDREATGSVELTARAEVALDVEARGEHVLFLRRHPRDPGAQLIATGGVGDREGLLDLIVEPQLAERTRHEAAFGRCDAHALGPQHALAALVAADAERDVDLRVEPTRPHDDLDARDRAVRTRRLRAVRAGRPTRLREGARSDESECETEADRGKSRARHWRAHPSELMARVNAQATWVTGRTPPRRAGRRPAPRARPSR